MARSSKIPASLSPTWQGTHAPEDSTEAATRAARSAYFNDPIGLPLTPASRDTILAGGFGGAVRTPLQLTRQAAAVFAGTVTSSSAHVTQDSRWVYSEVIVSADTVLKAPLVASRPVRPSYPQISERYLFFVDTNRTIDACPLIVAYTLGTATQETVRRLDADTRLPSFEGLTPNALLETISGLVGGAQ